MMPQRPYKPKVLGPCFQCDGYGHIAKFCNVPKKPYPFTQPVVSSAGVSQSAVRSAGHSLCCQSVDSSVVLSSVCVDEVKLVDHEVKECVDGQFDEHRNSSNTMSDSQVTLEITQFWELESLGAVQIADVQGRLKQCLPFWRDVLQAPPNILECIENGYRLPIKFIPLPFVKVIMTRLVPTGNSWMMQCTTCLKTAVWSRQINSPIFVAPCLWFRML